MNLTIDDYIDETIRMAALNNYHPTEFISMRTRYGTTGAIKRLLRGGELQSGFKKLCELGLKRYTIEAAALKFPMHFTTEELESAKWRLGQAEAAQHP